MRKYDKPSLQSHWSFLTLPAIMAGPIHQLWWIFLLCLSTVDSLGLLAANWSSPSCILLVQDGAQALNELRICYGGHRGLTRPLVLPALLPILPVVVIAVIVLIIWLGMGLMAMFAAWRPVSVPFTPRGRNSLSTETAMMMDSFFLHLWFFIPHHLGWIASF